MVWKCYNPPPPTTPHSILEILELVWRVQEEKCVTPMIYKIEKFNKIDSKVKNETSIQIEEEQMNRITKNNHKNTMQW